MIATSNDHPAATSDHDAPTTLATPPVTVAQAAAILGVSVTTVRRRIRDRSIRAEATLRPQGQVWWVYLSSGTKAATTSDHPDSMSHQTPTTSIAITPTTADAPVASIEALLNRLIEVLAQEQQRLEQSQARVTELERENGRLSAELCTAQTTVAMLEDQIASRTIEPSIGLRGRHQPHYDGAGDTGSRSEPR
jgi:excisionase family DNA binding protein